MTRIKDEKIQIVDFRYDEGLGGRNDPTISSTITTKSSGIASIPMVLFNGGGVLGMNKEKLRIRKLTPKECMRLMGFEDSDYQTLVDVGLSDSAIYHCAGDSIITTCLMALIGSMTDTNWEEKLTDYVERVKQ